MNKDVKENPFTTDFRKLDRVTRKLGQAKYRRGLRKGRDTESKLFNEFQDGRRPKGLPDWVLSVERATVEQDLYGHLDAIVYIKHFLDDGITAKTYRPLKIHVQIKTSHFYQEKFQGIHHSTRIAVIVIPEDSTPVKFLPEFYGLLIEERKWLAEKMNLTEYLESDQ